MELSSSSLKGKHFTIYTIIPAQECTSFMSIPLVVAEIKWLVNIGGRIWKRESWSAVSFPGNLNGQIGIWVLRLVQTRRPEGQAKYSWSRKMNLLWTKMLCRSLPWSSERLFRTISFFSCTHILILQDVCITDMLINSNSSFGLKVNRELCKGGPMGVVSQALSKGEW